MKTDFTKKFRYTEKTAKEILVGVRKGTPISEILKAPDMPDENTLAVWIADRKSFAERFDAAKADALIEDIIQIADDADSETLKLCELKIKTRQWLAEKLNPNKYGKSGNAQESSEPLVSVIRPAPVRKPDESGV